MLKKSLLPASMLLVLSFGVFAARPAMAATTSDALDQSVAAQNLDGSAVTALVTIPTLAAGAAVSGGGTMVIKFGGVTLYNGAFTATTLKSMTPPSAAGFSPIFNVTPGTFSVVNGFMVTYSPTSASQGPVASTRSVATVQLTAGHCNTTPGGGCLTASTPATQDLLLYCRNAGTTVDIGITLSSSPSNSASLALLNVPGGVLQTVFTQGVATSTGSLC